MTNFFEEITDHEQQALDRNVEVLKNATNFNKVISLFSEFIQEVESVLINLRDNRHLNSAIGVNLDYMGQILDVPRNNLGDDPYRRLLQAAYAKIIAAGQVEVLISAYALMLDADKIVTRQYYPGFVMMCAQVTDTAIVDSTNINENMQSIRAGGVRMDVGVAKTNRSFRYASVNGRTGTGRGFAEYGTPSVIGGEYGHLLR